MSSDDESTKLSELLSNSGPSTDNSSTGNTLEGAMKDLSIALRDLQSADEELRRSNEAAFNVTRWFQSELLHSNFMSETERRIYHELFHRAPDGLIVTDMAGIIREANDSAATLLSVNKSHLIRKPLVVFIADEQRRQFRLKIVEMQRLSGVRNWKRSWAAVIKKRKTESFAAFITVGPVYTGDYKPTALRWHIQDITETYQAVVELLERDALIEAILEASADGLITCDAQGRIELCNPAAMRMFGYVPRDMIGQSVGMLIGLPNGEKLEQHGAATYLKQAASGRIGSIVEVSGVRQDGSSFPLDLAVTEMTFEGRNRFIASMRDVTERKNAENSLIKSREEMLHLVRHLRTVREDERARIGLDLHDQLGQVLTVLKMEVSWLQRKLPKDQPRLFERTAEMTKQIDDALTAVGRIATDLRPVVLDHAGLGAAIEWQVREFQSNTGISCRMISTVPELQLDHDSSTALFRILQEALTNIARHSNAKRARVVLHASDNEVRLEVRDYGRGIRREEIDGTHSLGLLGMRERAQSLKGTVTISGHSGRGSIVIARIPVESRHDN